MSNGNVTIHREAFMFSDGDYIVFNAKYNDILITSTYKDFVTGRLDDDTIKRLASSLLETRFYYSR